MCTTYVDFNDWGRTHTLVHTPSLSQQLLAEEEETIRVEWEAEGALARRGRPPLHRSLLMHRPGLLAQPCLELGARIEGWQVETRDAPPAVAPPPPR